nr:YcgL domain-containing protein [Candidatus Enterovibrio escacola]
MTYLYIKRKDDFSDVPIQLLTTFGNPIFVMMLDVGKRVRLGRVDIEKVRRSLKTDGFFLQLPLPTDTRNYILRYES